MTSFSVHFSISYEQQESNKKLKHERIGEASNFQEAKIKEKLIRHF